MSFKTDTKVPGIVVAFREEEMEENEAVIDDEE